MKKQKQTTTLPTHVRPDALEAARELTTKLATPAGRRLSDDAKGRMLLAACVRHGVTITEIAEALDTLAAEVRASKKGG